jgi:tetratricopeptide (TPR) repeat protein
MGKFQDDTLWRQAQQAFQANQHAQAQTICERLLQRNSRNTQALDMLGRIYLAKGYTEKAASYIQKFAALRPRDPAPQLLLGEILGFQGEYQEAINRYDRALRLEPDHPKAVSGKAATYELAGQRDKARAVLEPYVTSVRDSVDMAIVQARLDLSDRNYDAVIGLAGRHLADVDIVPTVRWHLSFLMGQALERTGQYDEAFDAYRQANETLPVPFNAQEWLDSTGQIIEAFTPQRYASLPRATHGSRLPVFIVGMPRCGSTLVETIIDAHPEAHGAGEFEASHFVIESIPLEIGSNLPYPECIEDFDQNDVDMLGRAYLERLSEQNPDARRISDKYLINYRQLGLLSVLFPEGRIIHCRRHPLDLCLSCYALALMPHVHPWSRFPCWRCPTRRWSAIRRRGAAASSSTAGWSGMTGACVFTSRLVWSRPPATTRSPGRSTPAPWAGTRGLRRTWAPSGKC